MKFAVLVCFTLAFMIGMASMFSAADPRLFLFPAWGLAILGWIIMIYGIRHDKA
jgi:hypothetical protein